LVLNGFVPFLTERVVVPTPRDVPPLYVPVSDAFGPRILNAASFGVPAVSAVVYIIISDHIYDDAELSSEISTVNPLGFIKLTLLPVTGFGSDKLNYAYEILTG
jgi:hypothetical protein